MCVWVKNCVHSDSGNNCIDCEYAYIKDEKELNELISFGTSENIAVKSEEYENLF